MCYIVCGCVLCVSVYKNVYWCVQLDMDVCMFQYIKMCSWCPLFQNQSSVAQIFEENICSALFRKKDEKSCRLTWHLDKGWLRRTRSSLKTKQQIKVLHPALVPVCWQWHHKQAAVSRSYPTSAYWTSTGFTLIWITLTKVILMGDALTRITITGDSVTLSRKQGSCCTLIGVTLIGQMVVYIHRVIHSQGH